MSELKKVNIPTTWYTIDRQTQSGDWEEEQEFDTIKEAQEEIKFCINFMPCEKFRIAMHTGTIIFQRQ